MNPVAWALAAIALGMFVWLGLEQVYLRRWLQRGGFTNATRLECGRLDPEHVAWHAIMLDRDRHWRCPQAPRSSNLTEGITGDIPCECQWEEHGNATYVCDWHRIGPS